MCLRKARCLRFFSRRPLAGRTDIAGASADPACRAAAPARAGLVRADQAAPVAAGRAEVPAAGRSSHPPERWSESPMAQRRPAADRSEEHTSELHSLLRISYAVLCLKKKQSQRTACEH